MSYTKKPTKAPNRTIPEFPGMAGPEETANARSGDKVSMLGEEASPHPSASAGRPTTA
jgi:hypothetical protein